MCDYIEYMWARAHMPGATLYSALELKTERWQELMDNARETKTVVITPIGLHQFKAKKPAGCLRSSQADKPG